jgi:hypothetical protein
MKPENIEICERHLHHWKSLKLTGSARFESDAVGKEIEKVYQSEVNPNYYENLWCSDCVASLFKKVYTLYDKHLQSQEQPKLIEAVEKAIPIKKKHGKA